MRRCGRVVAVALLVLGLSSACGDGDAETSSPTTRATSPPDRSELTQSCTAPDAGYQLRFPQDWYSNDPSAVPPCRFFHPQPFELPRDTEATDLAISLSVENEPFARIAPTDDTRTTRVLSRNEARVAGKQAVRVETAATGEGLLPAGTRGVTYYVDFGNRTLVASTFDTAAAGTLEANSAVLDRMMATLSATDRRAASCSAGSLSGAVPPQEIPAPVAQTRRAIAAAAVACDYQALAALAGRGDAPFTYSFGDRGDPAEFWRQAEERGEPVLRRLVEILSLPVAPRTVNEVTHYLWPSAFVYEQWTEIPQRDLEALRRVYSEEELQRFAEFGSYAGHRVGISSTGEWLFFVAGD